MARKTNFERFVEGIGKVVRAAQENQVKNAPKPPKLKKEKPKLPQSQSVIEISFITIFEQRYKEIHTRGNEGFLREYSITFC